MTQTITSVHYSRIEGVVVQDALSQGLSIQASGPVPFFLSQGAAVCCNFGLCITGIFGFI